MTYLDKNPEPRDQLPRPLTIAINNADFSTCSIQITVVNTPDPPAVALPAGFSREYTEDEGIILVTNTNITISDEDNFLLYQAQIFISNTPNQYGFSDFLYLPADFLDSFVITGNGTNSITATGKSLLLEHPIFIDLLANISFATDDQATDITRNLTFTVEENPLGDTGPSDPVIVPIYIKQLNDKPVLTDSPFVVNTILDDYLPADTKNPGFLPSYFLNSSNVNDPDSIYPPNPDFIGLAIYQVDNGSLGSWQYWWNGTWSNITNISSCSPLFITNSQRVRFLPDPNIDKIDGNASFDYRVWDGTSKDVCVGNIVRTDQEASISSDTANFSYFVRYLNRAPVIVINHFNLSSIPEDQPTNGERVSELANEIAVDYDDLEISFVVVVADTRYGEWQYRDTYSSPWQPFPSNLSSHNALHLVPDSWVRFVPSTNFVGTSSITVRAWDLTNLNPIYNISYVESLPVPLTHSGPYSMMSANLIQRVQHVNDPPVLALTQTNVVFMENGPQVRLFNSLNITDSDNTELQSATVTLECPSCPGNIQLQSVPGSGSLTPGSSDQIISHSSGFNVNRSDTGSQIRLDITPINDASLLAFQNYLQSLYFTNIMEEPILADRIVTLFVSDGYNVSSNVIVTVSIQQDNDNPPVITLPYSSIDYNEGSGIVDLFPIEAAVITDLDESLNLSTLTVSLSGANNTESLHTTYSGSDLNVTSSIHSILFSGPASLVMFNDALNSLQYSNTEDEPGQIDRLIAFAINDGLYIRTVMLTVSVQPINDKIPIISLNTTNLTYYEVNPISPPLLIAPYITITDNDVPTTPVKMARIDIINAQDPPNEERLFLLSVVPGVEATPLDNERALVIRGTGGNMELTIWQVEQALRQVVYQNTAEEPNPKSRNISIVIGDDLYEYNLTYTDPVYVNIEYVLDNDDPAVILNREVVYYTEDQVPSQVILAPNATIIDVDNTDLAGLYIELNTTENIDHLYELLLLNFSLIPPSIYYTSINTSVGFELTGVAPVETYETILQSLTYNNVDPSGNPEIGTRKLIVTPVGIGTDMGVSDELNIDFSAVNNPPILDLNGVTLSGRNYVVSFTEESGTPVKILADDFELLDVDNTMLTSINITMSPYLDIGYETLGVIVPSDIALYQPNPYWISLQANPPATIDSFRQALSTLNYTNTADEPQGNQRQVEFVVSDGEAWSTPVTTTILLVHINDQPSLNLSGSMKDYATEYVENTTAVPIAPLPSLKDDDNENFTGLLVQVFPPYFTGDEISIVGVNLTTYNSGIYFAFFQPIFRADLEDIIATLAFSNNEEEPPVGTRVFCMYVSDGQSWSDPACTTVELIPINDNPPVFLPDHYSTSVIEEKPNFPLPLNLGVTDKDSLNSNVTFNWAIVAGDDCHQSSSGMKTPPFFSGDGSGSNYMMMDTPCRFTIDDNGVISTTATPPDREMKSFYNLTVSVSDGEHTAYAQVDVVIEDENDNPLCFDPREYNITISIGEQAGTDLLQLTTTDPDTVDGFFILYTLNSQQMLNLPIMIGTTTGILSLTVSENDPSFPSDVPLFVMTADVSDDRHTASENNCEATIYVTVPFNAEAPQFAQEMYSFIVSEDTQSGMSVFTITATDSDEGTNGDISYSIDTNGVPFVINSNTGIISLTSSLDFETTEKYMFTVEARDHGKLPRSSTVNVTALVGNVNEFRPMFTEFDYSESICENVPNGTNVVQLTANDDDSGLFGEITYTIFQTVGCMDCFSINPSTGVIYTIGTIDYETHQTTVLFVNAQDGGGNIAFPFADVTINVLNDNEHAPAFESTFVSMEIPENFPINAMLPTQVSATDDDTICSVDQCNGTSPIDTTSCPDVSSLTYSIQSGNSEGLFRIVPSTGVLLLNSTLDHETLSQMTFSLEIAVTDGQYTSLAYVQITVLNISEFSPIFDNSTYQTSIDENTSIGTVILTVHATDADSTPFTYALSGDNANYFYIDPITGVISIAQLLDREVISSFSLIATASEAALKNMTGMATVIIIVNDLNDNKPMFVQGQYDFNVPENEAMGTIIGTVSATDADLGINAEFVYFISSVEPANSTGSFSINSSSGQITALKTFDRESRDQYTLTVVAIDSGNLNTSVMVHVAITDVNDNTPRFSMDLFTAQLPEDTLVGSPVVTLVAYDNDVGSNAQLSYSIVSGNDFHFKLDPASGQLRVNNTLDYEQQTSYNLTIIVTDNGDTPLSSTTSVYITLEDVNDNAPKFTNSLSVSIPEHSSNNTLVLTLTATDSDEGSNALINFIITGPLNTPFTLDHESGQIRVLNSAEIDREVQQEHYINVVAFNPLDISGPNTTATVTVTLTDINDNSPLFDVGIITYSVDEDETPVSNVLITGSIFGSGNQRYIATINATDRDARNTLNSEITYTITGGSGESTFIINGNSGAIYSISPLDYEQITSYTLHITASDNGVPVLSSNVTVIINILDINDNKPLFDQSIYTVSISEALPLGEEVIQVTASDADSNSNAEITYTIFNTGLPFIINSYTGDITLNQTLDRETKDMYVIEVVATDHGTIPLSSTTQINVTIQDANDNSPIITLLTLVSPIPENTNVGFVVATFKITDADIGSNANTTLTLSGNSDHFAVDQNGIVTVNGILDYDLGVSSFNITLTARNTETPHLHSSYTFIIEITNLNDNAPIVVFETNNVQFLEGSDFAVELNVGITIEDLDGRNFTQIYDAKVEFINPNPLEPSYPFSPTSADNPSECTLEDKVAKMTACGLASSGTLSILPPDNKLTIFPNSDILTQSDTTLLLNAGLQNYAYLSAQLGHTTLSILSWIWYVPTNEAATIFSYVANDHTIYGAACHNQVDLHFTYYANNSEQTVVFNGVCNALVNQWHHLTLVSHSLTGTPQLTIYIDGVFYTERSILQPEDTNGKRIYLGARPVAGVSPPVKDYFTGRLHRMVVSSSVITDNNINCIIGCGVYLYSSSLTPPIPYYYNYTKRLLFAEGIREIPIYEQFLNTFIFVIAFTEPRSLSYDMDYTVTDGGFNCIPVRLNITIEPSNDGPPVLDLNGQYGTDFNTVFTEEAGPVHIVNTTSLTLTDVDLLPFPYMINATITNSPQPVGEEILTVSSLPVGMIQTYTSHSLIIDGMFSISYFQTVLRTLTYNNIANEPTGTTRTVSIVVNDPFQGPRISNTAYSTITILYVNDKPVLEVESTGIEYAEEDGVVPLLLGVNITDSDNTSLVSARIVFTAPDVTLETLSVNTTGTSISSTYNISVSSNMLVLTGEDTLQAYENVIASLSYINTMTDNITAGTRVFTLTLFDGVDYSEPKIAYLFIQGVNDVPMIDLNGESQGIDHLTNFVEDTDVTVPIVSPNLTITDVDSTSLIYVKITFSSRPDGQSESVLLTTTGTNLAVTESGNTYTIAPISSMSVPIDEFQSVLRTLRYQNTAKEPTPGHHTLEIVANDGMDTSPIVYSRINVIPTNDKPTLDLDSSTNGTSHVGVFVEESTIPTHLTSSNVKVADNDVGASIATVLINITNALDGMNERIVSFDENMTLPMPDLVGNELRYSITPSDESLESVTHLLMNLAYTNTLVEPTADIRYIEISVSDGIEYSNVAISIISVANVNDNSPIFASIYSGTIFENKPANTSIVTVIATDADSGNDGIVSYSIIGAYPVEGESRFTIESDTGLIKTIVPLDREEINYYMLYVRATDHGNIPNYSVTNVTIEVLDVNDNAPSFTQDQYSISVSELIQPGTIIDTIVATDPDLPVNSVIYEGIDDDNLFFVSPDGTISVFSSLDADIAQPVHNITVIAEDLGGTSTSVIYTITILDANDNDPIFDKSLYQSSVPENMAGAYVTTVSATDKDSTSNGELTYSFVDSATSQNFIIDNATGVVTTAVAFDRETIDVYEFVVKAVDGGSPRRTGQTTVQVSVLDLNDNAPVFNKSIYQASVLENAVGTFVTRVSATDNDNGINASIIYSLQGQQTYFEIVGDTGDIMVSTPLDYEIIPSLTITVIARDQGLGQLSSSATVTVNVIDVNDNAPVFIGLPYMGTVPENSAQYSILTIQTSDADSGFNAQVRYYVNNYQDLFSIDNSGVFSTSQELDFETQCYYKIAITAYDLGEPSLNTSTVVYVQVTPLNDRPPTFTESLYTTQVLENVAPGTSVFKVKATDDDQTHCQYYSGQSGSGDMSLTPEPSELSNVTYSLLNNIDEFEIDSSTGVISTVSTLDRETVSSYSLIISALDISGLSSNATVYVVIGDINDNEPRFIQAQYERTISENTAIGTSVLQVLATDLDTLDEGKLRYELTGQPSFLAINTQSGVVSVADNIDFETVSSTYSFFAIVKDTAIPNHIGAADIQIQIVDTNDLPPSINTLAMMLKFTEGEVSLRPFPNISISDPDSFQVISSAEIILHTSDAINNTATNCACTDSSLASSCTAGCVEFLQLPAASFDGVIAQSYDGHTLILTGNFSIAVYKSAIEAIEYINIISNPSPNNRTISVTVHDGILPSNILINTIQMILLNQFAPVVDLNGPDQVGINYNVTFTEEGPSISVVDSDATITDSDTALDTPVLTGLDVWISNPQDGVSETIRLKPSYNLPQEISHQQPSLHRLSLTGVASVTAYTSILLQLEYINNALEPSDISRHINFQAHEYYLSSQIASTTVTIVTFNDHAPMIIGNPPMNNYATIYRETALFIPIVASNAFIADEDSTEENIDEMQIYLLTPGQFDKLSIEGVNISEEITLTEVSNAHLTFSGSSTRDNYRVALLGTRYSFTGAEFTQSEALLQKYIFMQISDPSFSSFSASHLTLRPENDQQPQFSQSLYMVNLPENTSVGYTVLQLSASDGDTFNTSEIRYNITAGNDEGLFAISYTTGIITLYSGLNFEQSPLHMLTIQVEDLLYETGGASPSTATVEIVVGDANDNVPQFNQTRYNATIGEGVPQGTFVLQVFADDADSGVHAQLVFELTGTSDFSITSDGVIKTAAAIDRENIVTYSFNVTVRNPGSLAHDIAQVYVEVLDLDDNTPIITLSPLITILQEPQTQVTPVEMLTISDPDPLPSIDEATVTIIGAQTPGSLVLPYTIAGISLVGNGTKTLRLSGLSTLQTYETLLQSVVYMDTSVEPLVVNRTVTFQVSSGDSVSNTATIVITVATINDNPPVILLTTSTADGSYYTEFTEDGSPVQLANNSLTITDADSGYNQIYYSIVELTAAPDGDQEELTVLISRDLTLDIASDKHRLIIRGPGSLEDFSIVLRTTR